MTASECPPEEIRRIAALCTTKWHRDYTRIKLRTDPAYAAVLREVIAFKRDLIRASTTAYLEDTFVAAELLFAMGYCRQLLSDIERRAGPTVLRDLHSPA